MSCAGRPELGRSTWRCRTTSECGHAVHVSIEWSPDRWVVVSRWRTVVGRRDRRSFNTGASGVESPHPQSHCHVRLRHGHKKGSNVFVQESNDPRNNQHNPNMPTTGCH